MKRKKRVKMTPATVTELAAALKALGAYDGENTEAEHEKEAQRIGADKDFYRMRLANALLGIAETEAMLSEGGRSDTDLIIAHYQAIESAGAGDSQDKLLGFLRWRTLRIAGPLRQLAQFSETGPIPAAASWAADALQQMLKITSNGQHSDPDTLDPEAINADLKKAKESLTYAITNLDIMLDLFAQAEDLVDQSQSHPPPSGASQHPSRVERASKLLLLDMYVPLFVERQTTDFFLPIADWTHIQHRAQEWGIWHMSDKAFSAFEKKKMQEFTHVLATVSPEFPFHVFTLIDTLIGTTAKTMHSCSQTTDVYKTPRISELLESIGKDREKLFALARRIEPDLSRRFTTTPARNPREALLFLVDKLLETVQATQFPVPDEVRLELARFFAEYFPFSSAWPYSKQQMQAAVTANHPDLHSDIPDKQIP